MKDFALKIIKLLKLERREIVIFLPFMPIIASTDIFALAYIPFLVILYLRWTRFKRGDLTAESALMGIALYTVILPDNYTVMFFTGLILLYLMYKAVKNKKISNIKAWILKHKLLLIPIAAFILLNIVVNRVPIQNIILWMMYNFVFIALLIIFSFDNYDYKAEINRTFNALIVLQLIYLVVFIPLRVRTIIPELIGDWSIGTLGISQGPTLFNLFIFGFIKYIYEFYTSKKRFFILLSVLCFIGAVTTVTVALTLLFIFALVVYSLLYVKGTKYKVAFLAGSILLLTVFWVTADPWIREQVIKTATDREFRIERVKKLEAYENTFVKIPLRDFKFLLIGNGMGYYSSRAALTTSGYYVGWYNRVAPVAISEYTKEYIKPEIFAKYGVSATETPTSQYVGVMGEFGIIGMLLLMSIFFMTLYKEKGLNRLTIIYFMCIFTLDNWIEFPKVAMLFAVVYYFVKKSEKLSLR